MVDFWQGQPNNQRAAAAASFNSTKFRQDCRLAGLISSVGPDIALNLKLYFTIKDQYPINIGQIFVKMHFCRHLVMVVAYLCLSVLSRLLLSSTRLFLRKNITNMFMEHLSANQISFYQLFLLFRSFTYLCIYVCRTLRKVHDREKSLQFSLILSPLGTVIVYHVTKPSGNRVKLRNSLNWHSFRIFKIFPIFDLWYYV